MNNDNTIIRSSACSCTCDKRSHQVQRNFRDTWDWATSQGPTVSQRLSHPLKPGIPSRPSIAHHHWTMWCTRELPWAVGEELCQTHPCLTLFFLHPTLFLSAHSVFRVLNIALLIIPVQSQLALCFSYRCEAPYQVRWASSSAGFTMFSHQHQSNQLYPAARQVLYK